MIALGAFLVAGGISFLTGFLLSREIQLFFLFLGFIVSGISLLCRFRNGE